MAHFVYKACDSQGRLHHGRHEADSARQARQWLREQGWSPLRVELGRPPSRYHWRGGLNATQRARLTRQLSTLIQASVPLAEALGAVAAQSEVRRERSLMLKLRAQVLAGQSLSAAMRSLPADFPDLFQATVAAGERSGRLGLVMEQLADYTQAQQVARERMQMALVYPLILLLASVGIVAFLLGYVVPDVVAMFADSGQPLPWLTRWLIAASAATTRSGAMALLVVALSVAGWSLLLRQPAWRLRWHRGLLRLPLVGGLIRAAEAARFASTLAILGRSAVPLVDALQIAGGVVGNRAIRARLADVARQVGEGASLTCGLAASAVLPPMMLHLIASGERAGELDQMLGRAADYQQSTLAARLELLVRLFEPLMLVLMGAIVLVMVMAILLPILSLNQLVN